MMKAGVDYIGIGCGTLILNEQKKILVILRSKNAEIEGGTWSIPGGKVDFLETREQASIREAKEEIGCTIQVDEELSTIDNIVPNEKQHWIITYFLCRIVAGRPVIQEPLKHDVIGWYSIGELKNMPVSSWMKPLLKKLEEAL